MFVYQFHCKDCDLVYDELKEIGNNESYCPVCKKPTRRIMSVVNSNFTAWSDTVEKLGKWVGTPEPGMEMAE